MSEKKSRRPILYNGQVYSEPVIKKSGGSEKIMRQTFEEARDSVIENISHVKHNMRNMAAETRLPKEIILSLTLEPEFSAKSYYPDSLFDLDTERFGLKEVGSRIVHKTESIEGTDEYKVITSKMFFIRATEESLNSFEKQLKLESSTQTKKFKLDIRKITTLDFLPSDERVLGIPNEWTTGRLEAVLHPFDLDNEKSLNHFLSIIESQGVDMKNVKYKQYQSGVTFVSFIGSRNVLDSISEYNPLRNIHPLKMRNLPDIGRSTLVNSGPIEPNFSIKSPIVVGVIDGGINEENPFLTNYSTAEFVVSGNPLSKYVNHGTQVSGAVLYGPLNNFSTGDILPEPNVSIKSFGVLSDETDDPELYDVIDAMELFVPRNSDIKVYNLSLGPSGPVLDDSISRFTYSCDLLSNDYGVLFCVAVGNDGEKDGYDRIQSPADSVNCLGVGAFTKRDGKKVRASYSSMGPGREGGKMKPDIMAFGGCDQHPIHLIADNVGEKIWSLGTSFASPIVAGMAGQLIGESNGNINSLTAKALLIHSAESDQQLHCHEMGHGALPENIESITSCVGNSYTLIYSGEIQIGKYAEYLIPWEKIESGKVLFDWTVAVLTDVDQLSSDDYTSSSVEVAFYPNRNKYNFKNETGEPLGEELKKSEIVDIEFNSERATYLLENGWVQSTFPITGTVRPQYKTEDQLRADLKWDSLDTRQKSMRVDSINEPAFHIHALGRGSRNSIANVKFSLILTVTTPNAEIDIYETILNKYSALIPLEIQTEADISVHTNKDDDISTSD